MPQVGSGVLLTTTSRVAAAEDTAPASLPLDVPRANSDPEVAVDSCRSELIPLRDVVRCLASTDPESSLFELQVLQRDTTVGQVICLEFDAKSCAMRDRWILAIKL